MERLILPVDGKWEDVGDPGPAIEAWEQRTGRRLPDDYRAFMRKFNGGRPFPLMFRYQIPLEIYPSDEPVTFLDPLYGWNYVEEIWDQKVFSAATPPDMIFIGADPGGLELLLSVRPEDHGRIYAWLHSLDAWGHGGNTRIWPQAASFRAFIESLFENDAGDGDAYWRLPGQEPLERRFDF
ncbi:MAG: hypothetical protein VR78_18115 [Hoeflea sp. BRH_c9]|nr:MAG: hypothetical protein VR78_18115 [Hoeflea sp. BRH_c9]